MSVLQITLIVFILLIGAIILGILRLLYSMR